MLELIGKHNVQYMSSPTTTICWHVGLIFNNHIHDEKKIQRVKLTCEYGGDEVVE